MFKKGVSQYLMEYNFWGCEFQNSPPAKLNTWGISSNKNVRFLDGSFSGKEERGKFPGDYSVSDNFNQY